MGANEELKIFSGNPAPELAQAICSYLSVPLGQLDAYKFANDNTFVQILENVRERDVFLVQTLVPPTNDHVMELLIMIDAAKRASAGRITAVIPYYGYGRTDKKDQPRVPITARLLADILTVAGANRVLTIDLHAKQIQGFFNIPVDELTAFPLMARYFKQKNLSNPVVVAVDIGISKQARDVAEWLGAPLAIVEKRREGNHSDSEVVNIIGDVHNRNAILVDDEILTGGTLLNAEAAVREAGAIATYACCVHALLPGGASKKVFESGLIELVTTNTVPMLEEKKHSKLVNISIADLLGEAIHRIHHGYSVGDMFSESRWAAITP